MSGTPANRDCSDSPLSTTANIISLATFAGALYISISFYIRSIAASSRKLVTLYLLLCEAIDCTRQLHTKLDVKYDGAPYWEGLPQWVAESLMESVLYLEEAENLRGVYMRRVLRGRDWSDWRSGLNSLKIVKLAAGEENIRKMVAELQRCNGTLGRFCDGREMEMVTRSLKSNEDDLADVKRELKWLRNRAEKEDIRKESEQKPERRRSFSG